MGVRTGRIGHSKDCTNTLSACDEGYKGQRQVGLLQSEDRESIFILRLDLITKRPASTNQI